MIIQNNIQVSDLQVDFVNLEKSIPELKSDKFWREDFENLLVQYIKSPQNHLLVNDLAHYLHAFKIARILKKKPSLLKLILEYAATRKNRFNCALRLSEHKNLKSLLRALKNPLEHQEMLSGFPLKLLANSNTWKGRTSLAYFICPDLLLNENSLQIINNG